MPQLPSLGLFFFNLVDVIPLISLLYVTALSGLSSLRRMLVAPSSQILSLCYWDVFGTRPSPWREVPPRQTPSAWFPSALGDSKIYWDSLNPAAGWERWKEWLVARHCVLSPSDQLPPPPRNKQIQLSPLPISQNAGHSQNSMQDSSSSCSPSRWIKKSKDGPCDLERRRKASKEWVGGKTHFQGSNQKNKGCKKTKEKKQILQSL